MPIYTVPRFRLEGGEELREVPVTYQTWGRLNEARDNVLIVCHALTGSADVASWWGPLLGPDRLLDTDRFFVVCLNVPGSPYGSVSPLTTDPATGAPYGPRFPLFTVRDAVRLHHRVLTQALDVREVACALGGSMGGMQVLEWGFVPGFVQTLAPMAVGGRHSAWSIAWGEAQRQAIYADPKWRDGAYPPDDPPTSGLAAARAMAMIAYRTRSSFEARFGRARMDGGAFAVESYLRYQGEKLTRRFDASCYVRLTQLMDTHDVARGRGAYPDVLRRLEQPTHVLGIDSDVLYPLAEQQELAAALPHTELSVLHSEDGHDAFLLAFDQIDQHLRPWLSRYALPTRAAA